jgi:hypothetical protein
MVAEVQAEPVAGSARVAEEWAVAAGLAAQVEAVGPG